MAKQQINTTNPNYKDPSVRDFYVAAVIGEKAQGKSTFLTELAKLYIEENVRAGRQRRVLIHDPSLARSFAQFERITLDELKYGLRHPTTGAMVRWTKGIRCIGDEEDDAKTVQAFTDNFNNGLLILDEANGWMTRSGDLQKWQKNLFTKNRNLGLDVYCVFHRFEDIHIMLRQHIWQYILFRTPDHPDGPQWFEKRKFPNPKELYACWQAVESRVHDPSQIVQHYEIFEKSFKSRL